MPVSSSSSSCCWCYGGCCCDGGSRVTVVVMVVIVVDNHWLTTFGSVNDLYIWLNYISSDISSYFIIRVLKCAYYLELVHCSLH